MIVATAGHVDHGKTALVKGLTGVNTDRLAEEQKRGLSIDLGFAYHAHPQVADRIIGFIDVPGHQRFINTMISGVSGIDLGMLVVAADDGIMPQTLEHLDILRLLGITECIGVISKIDRVDAGRIEEVTQSVATLLTNFQGKAPVLFPVSNTLGEGIPALQSWLEARLLAQPETAGEDIFRMTVDRVFTLRGVGLVVTGTILAGIVNREDSVRFLPGGKLARVRSLHAQDRHVDSARKGQRCAINLAGAIAQGDIGKGGWLVGADSGQATSCFTAAAGLLKSPVNLRHRMQVKLYIGACHVPAKLGLLESHPELVQVLTDHSVSCCRGDRFLLRDYSEQFLLGGGRVLDPWPAITRVFSPEQQHYLAALDQDDFAAALQDLLVKNKQVIDFDHFRCAWNLDRVTASTRLVQGNIQEQLAFPEVNQQVYALSAEHWRAMQEAVLDSVSSWHQRHTDQPGMPIDNLAGATANAVDPRLLPALLALLQQDGFNGRRLAVTNGVISLAGFDQAMPEKTQKLWQKVEAILQQQGLEIPLLSELEKKTGVRGRDMNFLVSTALKSGRLVRISPKRVALPATLKALAGQVNALGASKPRFTVIDFRDQLGTGRNYAIEVLDYLDTIGFTQRDGNERMVVDSNKPEKLFGRVRKSDVPGGMPGLQSQ